MPNYLISVLRTNLEAVNNLVQEVPQLDEGNESRADLSGISQGENAQYNLKLRHAFIDAGITETDVLQKAHKLDCLGKGLFNGQNSPEVGEIIKGHLELIKFIGH